MLDSLPIFASLNFMVSECDCCSKKHIKRTVEINSSEIEPIYLGVTCAGSWFNINLSGNPYKAVARFNRLLRTLPNEQIEVIIEMIKEAQDE